MEHLPPHNAPGSAPTPPSSYSSPVQPSYYQHDAPMPVQRPNVIKRSLRFLLRRTMYVGIIIGRLFAPFKLALLIVLPLLAIIGVLTTALLWEQLAGPKPEVARVDSLPPAPDVESFLEGQQTHDAEKMWNAFSPSFKAQLMDRGLSVDELKEQAQNERIAGRTYLRPEYIGGVSLKSGGAMYFYMVKASDPTASKAMSFVFIVDNKGKIIGVDIG